MSNVKVAAVLLPNKNLFNLLVLPVARDVVRLTMYGIIGYHFLFSLYSLPHGPQ